MAAVNQEGTRAYPAVPNRVFCEWNFTEEDDGTYRCNNCSRGGIKSTGSNYSNLLTHCMNKS